MMNGIIPTIVNTAYIPGMVLAPFLMKKLGNGKSAFISFFLNAVAATIMLLTFKNGVVFIVIALYLFNFALGPQYIMQTLITADALDEIQLNSGERVEGFAQNIMQMFEIIGGVVAQFCYVFIYESFGLKENESGITNYDVLFDDGVRNPIFTWVIVTTIIASALAAIPFIFCKMTQQKHAAIIAELKAKQELYLAECEGATLLQNSNNGEEFSNGQLDDSGYSDDQAV